MAEHELPKLIAWVRFPSSAPKKQKEKPIFDFSFLYKKFYSINLLYYYWFKARYSFSSESSIVL